MTQSATPEHITDYERAVCYYTLPQVTHPLTYALIVAYAVCLFEAFGAILFGVLAGYPAYLTSGTAALAALIVFGIIVFTTRAFLNDLRVRRALAAAAGAPDAPEHVIESGEELPNPFAAHVLLQWRPDAPDFVYRCAESHRPQAAYRIEAAPHHRRWRVLMPSGDEYCDVRPLGKARSFRFGRGLPSVLAVLRGGEEVGRVRYRLTLRKPGVYLTLDKAPERTLVVRNEGIYEDDRLRGRIYELRTARYLDVEREYLCESLLAYFVVTA